MIKTKVCAGHIEEKLQQNYRSHHASIDLVQSYSPDLNASLSQQQVKSRSSVWETQVVKVSAAELKTLSSSRSCFCDGIEQAVKVVVVQWMTEHWLNREQTASQMQMLPCWLPLMASLIALQRDIWFSLSNVGIISESI